VNLAVIPARGGSKRIPAKNVRPFAGRPMIGWPIEAARESGMFDRIIVSTDADEIAETAREAGAEVPFVRPPELADDHCGTLEVITHAARWAADQGQRPDFICCLYATAVFAAPDDLKRGLETLREGGWDYVFAAGRYGQPVQRAFVKGADGAMELLFPKDRLTRSQDLAPAYHDAGQFYWGRTEAWAEGRPIFGRRTAFVELPSDRVQDIDTPEDWTKAERLFRMMRRNEDEQ
jgi:N-acylneuraminate cytidylyltransferase